VVMAMHTVQHKAGLLILVVCYFLKNLISKENLGTSID
jgi:hypothetical protein